MIDYIPTSEVRKTTETIISLRLIKSILVIFFSIICECRKDSSNGLLQKILSLNLHF